MHVQNLSAIQQSGSGGENWEMLLSLFETMCSDESLQIMLIDCMLLETRCFWQLGSDSEGSALSTNASTAVSGCVDPVCRIWMLNDLVFGSGLLGPLLLSRLYGLPKSHSLSSSRRS